MPSDPPEVGFDARGETVLATPAISGGAIYLRSDRHLSCVGGK